MSTCLPNRHRRSLSKKEQPWTQTAFPTFSIVACVCAAFLVISFLSWKKRDAYSERFWPLWLATLLAVVAFSISQLVGIRWQVPFFLGMIGLRSIALLALVNIPLAIVFFVDSLKSGRFLRMLSTILFLMLPFLEGQYALLGYVAISLVLSDLGDGQFGQRIWQS